MIEDYTGAAAVTTVKQTPTFVKAVAAFATAFVIMVGGSYAATAGYVVEAPHAASQDAPAVQHAPAQR